MINIHNRVYKYYPPYPNEINRTKWLSYMDLLLDKGRKYYRKPKEQPDYTQITEEETNRLCAYLFEDNTICEKEELVFSDRSNDLMDWIKQVMINNMKHTDDLSILLDTMIKNIIKYYIPHIEDLFEQLKEEHLLGDL